MKTAIRLTVFTVLSVSFAASADPLPDGWFMPAEAGWFESHGQPCPVVCKDEASYSEGEGYYVPRLENTRTYVCKVRNYDYYPFPQKGWLYGNNFNSHNYAPYCMVSNISGQVKRVKDFYCLCVDPFKDWIRE